MTQTILPSFREFPEEGAIIGRILAGYGELEFGLCSLLGEVLGSQETAVRTLFRVRSEQHRLQTADALMREPLEAAGHKNAYAAMCGALRWCKNLRNQYAHCHWFSDPEYGLFFCHMEEGAKSARGPVMHSFFHVDVPLLTQQEEYFVYAERWLFYLCGEAQKLAGKEPSRPWPAPQTRARPPRHNPQEEHPLPMKAIALARLLEEVARLSAEEDDEPVELNP